MASFGMMGALGGLGASLQNEAAIMQKEEEATAADARRTKLEQWLMTAREEIAIKAEGRAETRAIASEGRARVTKREDDEYAYGKKVERAPGERARKVEDQNAEAGGKLAFETENIDTITGNKKAVANASQSDADVALKDAQATFYSGRNEAAAAKVAGRLTPEDKAEMDGLNSEIRNMKSKISDAQIKGEWDDKAPTPGQMKALKDMRVMEQRRADIIARYREESPAPKADPLNRNKPAKEPAAQSGMMGAFTDPNDPVIAAAIEDIKDPQERANARAALQAQRSGAGKAAPAAAKPAPTAQPAAAVADPLENFTPDPTMDAKVRDEEVEMGAGKRMQYSAEVKPYVDKLRSLKLKTAEQKRREMAQLEIARSKSLIGR